MISNKLVAAFIMTTGLATANAFAGGRGVGNGGDVIVCPNSIEMLDSYEARIQRGIRVDPSLTSQSILEVTKNLLDRLESKEPVLGSILRPVAIQLAKDIEGYLSTGNEEGKLLRVLPLGTHLTDIDDSQELLVPAGCDKVQLGIQTIPKFKEDKTFYVRGDLLKKMSGVQAALFVMHEVIFQYALRNEATNSVEARYLNSLIASEKFDQMTMVDYLQSVNNIDFLKITPIVFDRFKFARAELNRDLLVNSEKIEVISSVKINRSTVILNRGSKSYLVDSIIYFGRGRYFQDSLGEEQCQDCDRLKFALSFSDSRVAKSVKLDGVLLRSANNPYLESIQFSNRAYARDSKRMSSLSSSFLQEFVPSAKVGGAWSFNNYLTSKSIEPMIVGNRVSEYEFSFVFSARAEAQNENFTRGPVRQIGKIGTLNNAKMNIVMSVEESSQKESTELSYSTLSLRVKHIEMVQ